MNTMEILVTIYSLLIAGITVGIYNAFHEEGRCFIDEIMAAFILAMFWPFTLGYYIACLMAGNE